MRGAGREGWVARAGVSRGPVAVHTCPDASVKPTLSEPEPEPPRRRYRARESAWNVLCAALATQTLLGAHIHSTGTDAFHTGPRDTYIRWDAVPSDSDCGRPPSVRFTAAGAHTPRSAGPRASGGQAELRAGPRLHDHPARPAAASREAVSSAAFAARSPALRSGREPAARPPPPLQGGAFTSAGRSRKRSAGLNRS